MNTSRVLVAAVLTLMISAAARADFSLIGTEHLDVTWSHANGYLSDSSTADVLDGGSVSVLYAHDSSTVDISGGNIGLFVTTRDSVVRISDGSVSDLYAYQNSTVDISGGQVAHLGVFDTMDIPSSNVVTFHGYDFQATAGLSLDGNKVVGTGLLTGKWLDGILWVTAVRGTPPGATIQVLPEMPLPPLPPEAHAGGPYTIFLGESVTLDAGGSMDPNLDIVSYRWDLDGDEAFETDAGDQFTYEASPTYLASLIGGGHHTISVLVTDGEGLSDTDETLLTIMTYGDANIDGFVDDLDLAWLLSYWTGPLGTGGTWAHGDFDGDGSVSEDDLSILLANWTGSPPAGATIPEPATLSLLAVAPLAAMRRRREPTRRA